MVVVVVVVANEQFRFEYYRTMKIVVILWLTVRVMLGTEGEGVADASKYVIPRLDSIASHPIR